MENKVRFKLHKVKKHWITIAASSLAIGASLIGLEQVGADEVKPETTAVNSLENVVSDSNLETSDSLITRTEVAPTRILLVQQYLLTLHLLMRLVSLQKRLLHNLLTRLIRRVGQLQLTRQLQPIGVLNLSPTSKIQMKISQRLLRLVSIHYQDKKSLSLKENSHPTIKAIGTTPRTEKISLDGIM